MKFSAAAAFALSFLSMGAFAAPTTSETGLTSSVSTEVTVCSVLTEMYSNVQVHTAKINGTYTSLSKSPSIIEKNTCIAAIKVELSAMCDVITTATTKLHGCKAGADFQVIVGLVVKIMFEIIYTMNGCIAFLGASALWMLSFSFNLVISVMANMLLVVEGITGGVLASAWGMISVCLSLVLPSVGSLFFGLGSTLHGQCGCVNQ